MHMKTGVLTVDDETLLERVRDGDQVAFHELYEKFQPNLFKLVHYKTNDYALAQDLVQETFVRVWTNRETLKPSLGFFSLIAKISQNLAQDHYKHLQVRSKHAGHVQLLTDIPPSDPEENAHLNRLQARIHEVANNDLPKKCRTIFQLSRVTGMSNQEIAQTLQITKKTVENQLHHALKVLRKKCEGYL